MNRGAKKYKVDLTGREFHWLTVTEWDETTRSWICSCKCGKQVKVKARSLLANSRKKRSCGCLANAKRLHRIRKKAASKICLRCNEKFEKPKGEDFKICPVCRTKCSRCDVILTDENNASTPRKKYFCKNCAGEYKAQYYSNNKNKQKDARLIKRFGITLNEYNLILQAQDGKCWICNKLPSGNSLAVDHKHEKGEKKQNPRRIRSRVRGLLCWNCNSSIARFRDNPDHLKRAAVYLETWPAQHILGDNNAK